MSNMFGDKSIFSIINDSKKLIKLVNNRYNRIHSGYLYTGKSINNVVSINIHKRMVLTDKYELQICSIKSLNNKPLKISCNAVNIISEHKPTYSVIFESKEFIDIKAPLIFDTKIPLPNPLIFIGDNEFYITIQLKDK